MSVFFELQSNSLNKLRVLINSYEKNTNGVNTKVDQMHELNCMLNVNQRTNNFNHFAVVERAHSTSHEHDKLVEIVLHELLCFLHGKGPTKKSSMAHPDGWGHEHFWHIPAWSGPFY